MRRTPLSTLFPYTTLFRSVLVHGDLLQQHLTLGVHLAGVETGLQQHVGEMDRSEEHTSELQSHVNLVCRLLLEKKNNTMTDGVVEEQELTKTVPKLEAVIQ